MDIASICGGLESSTIKQILHGLVDQLVGLPALSYSKFSNRVEIHNWAQITSALRTALLACAPSAATNEWIVAEYGASPITQTLIEVVALRRDDLRIGASNHASQQSACHLRDFDWQLTKVLGSDKVATMDDLLVQVNFDLRCQGEKKSLTVEMDGNQLDSLIDTLENINKEVLLNRL